MDKISSPNRQKKEKIVAELAEKIKRSKGMVFTGYQGLTHKQLEGLKKRVKALEAEFIATKNTLLKLSLAQTQKDKAAFEFKNATATLFLYADPAEPLKEVARYIKEFNLPVIKFGILDKEILTSEQILKLASLPSRQVLLAELLFGLKSPISRLHQFLLWSIQKFVMTLKAIETKKS